MPRIVVLGPAGSGKTSLCRALSSYFGIPPIELDAHYWQSEWTPAPLEHFSAIFAEITRLPGWVVDGNYTAHTVETVWRDADLIIWLNLPYPLVFWRCLMRSLMRSLGNYRLWHGNRERVWRLLTADSVLAHSWRGWRKQRGLYPELLGRRAHNGQPVLIIERPMAVQAIIAKADAAIRANQPTS